MITADKISKLEITWSLIFKSLIVSDLNLARIEKTPRVQTISVPTNHLGKRVRNPSSYKRAGGIVQQGQRPLIGHEASWYFIYSRSVDIAKFLYKYGLKEVANPLYTLGKFLEKNPGKYDLAVRMFFNNRNYSEMISRLLTFLFSKKLRDNIRAIYKSPVLTFTLNGDTIAQHHYANSVVNKNVSLSDLKTFVNQGLANANTFN
jgi:hypothetical protein